MPAPQQGNAILQVPSQEKKQRDSARKMAINASNRAVFKTLYLLDCALYWSRILRMYKAVLRLYKLKDGCIVPKIFTFK